VAAGLSTLLFYLLLFLVSILVLYIVNVPLTMFTVLGGALAIGVGFGSQYVVRNFISGLILLMERPIKVGDMVQLDDTTGVVERIGPRSTVLRSFSNMQVIVPNSDFLEKKVINWTLSDDLARVSVSVGVSYGSATRDVAQLLQKAVEDHGKILKTPEPVVLFSDFGDNALKFEVHFWIRMRTMLDRKRLESDVRFRIESLFHEAGVVIAFPQRDIRLEASKPLQVQIMEKET
jgi:small-conductance mechanosensitive channel